MADRRRETGGVDVGNPHRQGGVTDQGGFEDQSGSTDSGGGLGLGGLAAEGVRNGAPSERGLMINASGRQVEDEAAYDELMDLHPGRPSDRPIRVVKDDDDE